jgi:uncharacterized protein YkwD
VVLVGVLISVLVGGAKLAGPAIAGELPLGNATVLDDSTPEAGSAGTTTGGGQGETGTDESSSGLNEADIEEEIVALVKENRRERDVARLNHDPGLREIARYHSQDMAESGYVAHENPETGETMEDRYAKFQYSCSTPGENVFHAKFEGYSFSESEIASRTVEAWLDSQQHRELMLSSRFEAGGVGVEIVEEGRTTHVYVTQNFC